jgi:folate-binding protein YgfZ
MLLKAGGCSKMPCVHLGHRGLIRVQGQDKLSFLQGQITQDIHVLEMQPIIYGFFLTPNGRFWADAFLFYQNDTLYIDCALDQQEALLKRLNMYKLRSEVVFEPEYELKVYAFWGESAPRVALEDPRYPQLGYRCYVREAEESGTLQDYDALRLSFCVPDGNRDMTAEKSIPLEWGMDDLNAISFEKGCYMGQELTSRTKHTGIVRKRICVVDGTNVQAGAPIMNGDHTQGEIIRSYGNQAFAMLYVEGLQPARLRVEGQPLNINAPIKGHL